MKVLITGGRGFVGTNLIPVLSKRHSVKVYDIKEGNDIFDDNLEKEIKKADIVIHLAALTSIAHSFKDPNDSFMVNTLGTARVARLCVKYRKKLIYPSSAAVMFPDLSPYAYSKKVAEQIVKGIIGATDVVILRFCNIFGPNMNSNSGSLMYNFLTSKKLVVFGNGDQTRDFIHIRDITGIIESAFQKRWNGQVVDVGTGQAYTINYVADLFSHFRGLSVSHQIPKREMRWNTADITLLKNLYKRKLTTDLEKDIRELCQK